MAKASLTHLPCKLPNNILAESLYILMGKVYVGFAVAERRPRIGRIKPMLRPRIGHIKPRDLAGHLKVEDCGC
jgi:hypothetical protein